jgi:hypothetical protein
MQISSIISSGTGEQPAEALAASSHNWAGSSRVGITRLDRLGGGNRLHGLVAPKIHWNCPEILLSHHPPLFFRHDF